MTQNFLGHPVPSNDDPQQVNPSLTHNVNMLAGICEPIRGDFLVYKLYISEMSQQVTNDKAIVLNACYTIGRMLSFPDSKSMATNGVKFKDAMKFATDDEITKKDQEVSGHSDEAWTAINKIKCNRCNIGLKNQTRLPKGIPSSFLTLDLEARLYTSSKECHDMTAKTTAVAPVPAADDADGVTIWLKQFC